jgi:hypothetical protein
MNKKGELIRMRKHKSIRSGMLVASMVIIMSLLFTGCPEAGDNGDEPVGEPTPVPTDAPTTVPTGVPTAAPTNAPTSAPPGKEFYIRVANDPLGTYIIAEVILDNTPVSDAVVTVNGETIPWDGENGYYYDDTDATFSTIIDAGDQVTAAAWKEADNIDISAGPYTMPGAPLNPAAQPNPANPAQDITITWSSPNPLPDSEIILVVPSVFSASGFDEYFYASISDTSYTIPGGTLLSNNQAYIYIFSESADVIDDEAFVWSILDNASVVVVDTNP